MFFEGTEKKIEIVFSSQINIRKELSSLWEHILGLADIKILSSINNEVLDAYLLSESSLFIWDHRILIITCGRSKLINSIEYILKTISQKNIEFLIYERKNEYLPLEQKTSFSEDAEILNKYGKGDAFLLGELDEHHMLMYHLSKKYRSLSTDQTTQILISGLALDSAKPFILQKSKEELRILLDLVAFFPGFLIDDYIFSPSGYSINAIKDSHYYSIHITPQSEGSYVSFETNIILKDNYDLIKHFIDIFKPRGLDWISYLPQNKSEKALDLTKHNYIARNTFTKNISSAYKIIFTSYISMNSEKKEALCLKI